MGKILIVEDDALIADLERDYLEANGFEVTVACDGIEGEIAALSGGYDTLLLDVMLPGKTGFDVWRCQRTGAVCIWKRAGTERIFCIDLRPVLYG